MYTQGGGQGEYSEPHTRPTQLPLCGTGCCLCTGTLPHYVGSCTAHNGPAQRCHASRRTACLIPALPSASNPAKRCISSTTPSSSASCAATCGPGQGRDRQAEPFDESAAMGTPCSPSHPPPHTRTHNTHACPARQAHHGLKGVLARVPHTRGRVHKVEVAVHQLLQARRKLVGQVAQGLRGGKGTQGTVRARCQQGGQASPVQRRRHAASAQWPPQLAWYT